jgi:NADPH-dependent glutamate synthase beta subunit-like oxidoreductase
VGQNPDELIKALAARPEPPSARAPASRFRFLASPKRVVAENGRVVGLDVEETRLERKGDRINAVGTGEILPRPCDTVVFAVGDRVDERFGLPYKDGLYVTAPNAQEDPGAAYEVWDPESTAAARRLRGGLVAPGQRWRGGARPARRRDGHQARGGIPRGQAQASGRRRRWLIA